VWAAGLSGAGFRRGRARGRRFDGARKPSSDVGGSMTGALFRRALGASWMAAAWTVWRGDERVLLPAQREPALRAVTSKRRGARSPVRGATQPSASPSCGAMLVGGFVDVGLFSFVFDRFRLNLDRRARSRTAVPPPAIAAAEPFAPPSSDRPTLSTLMLIGKPSRPNPSSRHFREKLPCFRPQSSFGKLVDSDTFSQNRSPQVDKSSGSTTRWSIQ